ncbi:MAG: HTTM domain-containing protein, partial [Myxococcota bacterium]
FWRAWVARPARVEDGTSLALVRIAVGLVVAWDLGHTWATGALGLLWGDVRDTPEGYRTFDAGGLFDLLGGARLDTVHAVVAVTMAAAGMLALGVAARPAAFVALQGCIALFALNPVSGGGHDRVVTNALWLLVLADSARTLSLGARLRTGRWVDPTPVRAWPRDLLVFQLVVMYTTTGLQKVGAEWFPWGGLLAVHNMLLEPAWARFDLAPYLGALGPLTRASTALTWLWEASFWVVGLALLRGWRRVRDGYVLLGVAFHLGLLAVTDLGPFSPISLALYPALFRPDEWPWRRGTPSVERRAA